MDAILNHLILGVFLEIKKWLVIFVLLKLHYIFFLVSYSYGQVKRSLRLKQIITSKSVLHIYMNKYVWFSYILSDILMIL